MKRAKLPRSKGAALNYIAGPVWDELCDRLEKLEGFTVAQNSGLDLIDQPGGMVLSAKPRPAQPLPTGQYQHMLYGMVSQNEAAFDFARAHGILDV